MDYELIATIALLETAADRRENLLRQIYDINRNTIEAGRKGEIGTGKEKTFGDPDPGRRPARSRTKPSTWWTGS